MRQFVSASIGLSTNLSRGNNGSSTFLFIAEIPMFLPHSQRENGCIPFFPVNEVFCCRLLESACHMHPSMKSILHLISFSSFVNSNFIHPVLVVHYLGGVAHPLHCSLTLLSISSYLSLSLRVSFLSTVLEAVIAGILQAH